MPLMQANLELPGKPGNLGPKSELISSELAFPAPLGTFEVSDRLTMSPDG